MPLLILGVAPRVTMVVTLRELETLSGREDLNDVILVEVYYWI